MENKGITHTVLLTMIDFYDVKFNLLSRRRQALCRVGSKIYLFGGTSPYNGPPLFFTPEQLSMLPQQVCIYIVQYIF